VATLLVFANQKGGVTKTTSAANLGAGLAEMGDRVLLIDADPQANLTEAFGAESIDVGLRLEDLLARPRWGHAPAVVTEVPDNNGGPRPLAGGVHLIPCSEELAAVAAELAGAPDAEFRLRDVVRLFQASYDYILIDTPPGIGPLSTMALIAADWVVVPARPADHDVAGASKVYDLIEGGALAEFNPNLKVLGVLITQGDARWRLRRDSHEGLDRARMTRLPVEIPFAVRVGAAPRYGAPTIVLEPDSRVGCAYRDLAHHVRRTLAA
jgi:chromosome partitioning protein